jgi:dihydrofolate reductase
MRPRCSVFIATSLDGYIARRDGGIDWLSLVETPGEDYGYAKFFAEVDALILGRGTYDKVLTFPAWPYGDKRCVVLTHGSYESRHGERFHAGDPAPLLAELRAGGVRRVYVDGGAVIRQFLRDGLIDDLTISIIPIVLGDGIPLFDASLPTRRLRLAGSQTFPSGLVQLRYDVTAD